MFRSARHGERCVISGLLLRIELNDELLFNRSFDLFSCRESYNLCRKVVAVNIDPLRNGSCAVSLYNCFDFLACAALLADRNNIARFQEIGSNVNALAVHFVMTVTYKLTSLCS